MERYFRPFLEPLYESNVRYPFILSVREAQNSILGQRSAKHSVVHAVVVEGARYENGERTPVCRLRRLADQTGATGGCGGRHTTLRQVRMVLHGTFRNDLVRDHDGIHLSRSIGARLGRNALGTPLKTTHLAT